MTQENQAWENKRKHLEMIQAIITRMAGNLFFLRGWTITLLTGLLALSATKNMDGRYILLAFLPLAIFWGLDGYFLSLERRFRELYDEVCKQDEKDINFSMKISRSTKRNNLFSSIFSPTLIWFYGSLLAVLILLVLYS